MAVYADTATAQFENVNSLRNFPFLEPPVSNDGRSLPDDFIVDLRMAVPVVPHRALSGGTAYEYQTSPARLISARISRHMVSMCVKVSDGASSSVLSVMVSAENFRPYFPYRMEKLVGYGDAGGIVTFGDLELPERPETYVLNTPIHPCCIALSRAPALRSFVDPRNGESVSGDVEIVFDSFIAASRDGNGVRLSLEKGAETELASYCEGTENATEACGATPITSINGVAPDSEGNIVLWFH